MSNPNLVIERIRQNKETGKLWDFPGGIHPMENKSQSNSKPIRTLNLPKFFYVPLVQHSGWAGELLVKVGDVVLKGQPLTKGDHFRQLPVHSPTSGRVIGIEPYVSAHASGLPEITVIIETDGKDKWVERQPIEDFKPNKRSNYPKSLPIWHCRFRRCGIPNRNKIKFGG